MRIDREHLVFKALCALSEIVEQCGAGPVSPSLALRFSLAYLFSVSDGDRSSFDTFWKVVQTGDDQFHSETMARAMRGAYARTEMTGIARSVGVELTVDYMGRLSAACRGGKLRAGGARI